MFAVCTGGNACGGDELQYNEINTSMHEWRVTIDRNAGDGLGVSLDFADGKLAQITSIDPGGALGMHNEGVRGDQKVMKGDFLISVNGATETKEMLLKIKGDGNLELTVNRPSKFVVDVRKHAGKPVDVGTEVKITSDSEKYEKECKNSRLSWPFLKDGTTRRDTLSGRKGTIAQFDAKDKTVQVLFSGDEELKKWVPIRSIEGFELWQMKGIDLGLHYVKDGCSLLIVDIVDNGAISEWNDKNPRKRVMLSDRIMKVNAVKDNPENMLAEINVRATLRLVIVRPSTEREEDDTELSQPPAGCVTLTC
jgi:hypothetical protein